MKFRAAILTAPLMCSVATFAQADDFLDRNRSTQAQGLSFAGVTAGSGGLQSMGFNPAALGFVPAAPGSISVAGGLSFQDASYDGQPNIGGAAVGAAVDAGVSSILGNGYLGYRLNNQITLGLGLSTPFSQASSHPPGWLGQFDTLRSDVDTLQISPTLAFQPNPDLTLAVAVNILALNYEMATASFSVETDAVEYGFSLGALWNATPTTTFGLAYTHGYSVDASGTVTVPAVATADGSASFDLPSAMSFGVTQEVNDRVRLMGEVQWENWSALDQIDVSAPTLGLTQTDVRDYQDSFFIALGGEIDLVQSNWTLRSGIAYDQTSTNTDIAVGVVPAVINPLATNRTAAHPEADRVLFSVGGSTPVGPATTLDLAYTYVGYLEDAAVGLRNAPAGSQISYDGSEHIFSVGFSADF